MTKQVFETLYLFKRDLFFATAKRMLTGSEEAFCIPRERLPSVQRAIDNSSIRFWTDVADQHFQEWLSERGQITACMHREAGWLDFYETVTPLAWGDDPGFIIGEFLLSNCPDPSIGGDMGQGYFWVSADRWKDWYSLRTDDIEVSWYDNAVKLQRINNQARFEEYAQNISDPYERHCLNWWTRSQARSHFINTTYPVVENRRPDRSVKPLKGANYRPKTQGETLFQVIVKRRPERAPCPIPNSNERMDTGRQPNILHVVSEFTRMQWYPSEKVHRPVVIKEFMRGTDDPTRQRPTRIVKVAR